MKAGQRVWDEIKLAEGCVLRVYPDLNHFPTFGWGHKLTASEQIQFAAQGNVGTQVQADSLLTSDITTHEADVNSLNLLNLTQGKFDALVDFDYNLGLSNLKTMLAHGINMVSQELPLWVHAGGQVEPGLVKRRTLELMWWRE